MGIDLLNCLNLGIVDIDSSETSVTVLTVYTFENPRRLDS
jgi:hypothetical protein